MAIAEIELKARQAARRRRGEGAQNIHLLDAARLAGEAFGCEDEGREPSRGAGAGWSVATAAFVAGAMLLFGV